MLEMFIEMGVSIHAPVMDANFDMAALPPVVHVSIHAPVMDANSA